MHNKKKIIKCAQAIEIAIRLFEENIDESEIRNMLKIAKLDLAQNMLAQAFLEWQAFIHATIVYSLMHHAPAVIACEYIKNIKGIMKKYHHSDDEDFFIDKVFSAYMQCFVADKAKECPQVFIKKTLNININTCSTQTIQIIAGVMALTISNILDKIELFEMLPD